MTQLVTSSFFSTLPAQFAPISIARWAPRGQRHLPTIRELTPGPWFRSVDVEVYRRFYREQLAKLDARNIIRRIEELAAGRSAALLCWERPRDGTFCHRGYVSAWLHDQLDLEVPEYSLEHEGAGWMHPKLPPEYRVDPAPRLPL